MKRLALFFATVLLMCACSPSGYYQLYKVSTDGLKQTKDQLTFENEHCIITYNLWAANGDLSFTLYNKTDKDLFIVMPQSFFIQNDVAYDYYTNTVHTSRRVSQVGGAVTYANAYTNILGNNVLEKGNSATYGQTVTSEKTTTTKELAIVCIPPRAKKFFNGFNLVEQTQKDCEDYDFNYPKKKSEAITYDKESSPWDFRNRIAYSFDKEGNDCQYIENELWVSYLQNYSAKEMQEKIVGKVCETNLHITKTIILNKAPNAFYTKYTKTPRATKQRRPVDYDDKDGVYSVRWR